MPAEAEDPTAEVMPRPPEFSSPGPIDAVQLPATPPVHPQGAPPVQSKGAPPGHSKGAPPGTALSAAHQELTRVHSHYLGLQRQIVELLSGHRALPATDGHFGQPALPAGPDTPVATETELDPQAEPWIADHSPFWTTPVLPLICVADLLAGTVGRHAGRAVRSLRDLQMRRWLPVDGRTPIRISYDQTSVGIEMWWEAATPALSRFVPVATATPGFESGRRPARFRALADSEPMPDPYATAEMFHGPAFQYLTSARIGAGGATATLDAARGTVPRSVLHPGLLDTSLHVITPAALRRWVPELTAETFAFPHRVDILEIYEPLPEEGIVEAEARVVGADRSGPLLVTIDLQLCREDRVLIAFRVVFIGVPTGHLTTVPAAVRRDYFRDRTFVPELLLSDADGEITTVHRDAIEGLDPIPGTTAAVYALDSGPALPQIAAKEHLARKLRVHPCRIGLDADLRHASYGDRSWPITVTQDRHSARVHDRH